MVKLEGAELIEVDAMCRRWGKGVTGADVEALDQLLEGSRNRKPWLHPFVLLTYRLPGPKSAKAGRLNMSRAMFNIRWRESLQYIYGALSHQRRTEPESAEV